MNEPKCPCGLIAMHDSVCCALKWSLNARDFDCFDAVQFAGYEREDMNALFKKMGFTGLTSRQVNPAKHDNQRRWFRRHRREWI